MSGVEGVPLWHESQWEYVSDLQTDEPASHVAFTKPVAAALVALASLAPDVVTELSRTSGDPFIAGHFEDALDALDSARAQESAT